MLRSRSMPYTLSIGILLLGLAWVARSHFHPQRRERVPPPSAARIRAATAGERTGAIRSITAQLQAFKKDDYRAASVYQSAMLKRNFSSVTAFRQMMLTRYPQFAHYKSVQFGPAVSDPAGHRVSILVGLTGQDGARVGARYLMEMEGKVYKVASVSGGAPPPVLNS